ncbi:GTPase activating protein and centrosome-associated isoform X1 [Leptinotarsa decemlineata]|uniref:GTPase activating protein and centrosome-associated isoform X1 n=1 Tax=Leptinotarsa decemlineata TaxID=7539 RepID=UPI000C2559B2|nr:rab GTPase-activating protein 1-like isoform X1 [Leptinotarsa decemlineata]
MEDNSSVKSDESIATSDEYCFVGDTPGISKTPTLNFKNGDLEELANALSEVLQESDSNISVINTEGKKIGHSTFYGSPVELGKDPLSVEGLSPTEKQDSMKPDASSEEECSISDVDQECTIFSGVTYLGAATINAPKSEAEIQRNMAILNEQSIDQGLKISVSVPSSSQGLVVLYDANSHSVISRYEIHRILFYARGSIDTSEAGCFAFTWSHGDTQESAIFQCHVFRCEISEAVSRVSTCFAKAFQRVPRSMSSSVASAVDMTGSVTTISEARTLLYVFEVNLEIKEDDGKGSFATVGKDKNGFRLKMNLEKQFCLGIRQVSDNGPQLFIERCFGVLVAAGRHVRHSDMQLLEMKEQVGSSLEKNCTTILANWDPTEATFEPLNVETPKDMKQYMTVAVDLVIRGIQEPVRFLIETPVKIYSLNERNFWYFQRKSLVQQFFLNLKEVVSDLNDIHYEVLNMETSGELDRNLLNLNLNLSSLIQSPSITSIDTLTPKEECSSDGDEPLLSGTGLVSKDCSEIVLENWAEVLCRWKTTQQKPKQLAGLVRLGIPEALRGEVWQRLAGVEENTDMMENYRLLITKESSCENVIQRDIARTFPAHDFFKEAGGLGQDSLYRVSKAYAAFDSEVGYCQGLSFLAATLLLHMPEEQAFCVLVKLMYDYRLRDLYKDGFDNLYLRLYQLNKLMEEQLTPLWLHFAEHHIETHMFASQWFLTLFTARFPLYFVFHIIDVFLLQGIDTLFQIALALLMLCKKDLMQLDFEGILKYFRVSLPKKCRTEESAKQLIKSACSLKVKKLKKYEADFIALKEAAFNAEKEANEVEQLRADIARYEEERKLMMDEITQLKDMLKREVNQAEVDKRNNMTIITDYQMIRQRLESQLQVRKTELDNLKSLVSRCERCSAAFTKYNPELTLATEDQMNETERIRELELELAQTKLAHVEAECRNQNLTHQLRAAELEFNTAKNSWPPWLSKTLTSIKEVANKKDFHNIPVAHSNIPNTTPTFISHVNIVRRESVPLKHDKFNKESRRESVPIIKDSQSCSSLKGHH